MRSNSFVFTLVWITSTAAVMGKFLWLSGVGLWVVGINSSVVYSDFWEIMNPSLTV